ncbi:hypothetical protein CEXT_751451 [Caerostris extrusa]|uniref:Uncharacterized protein n=1 Tax=Caerostris extrusa TaxID=172846 RepID=A0AAV4N797_CAEEX|nr:hypothetical protein CEXT_751451 [Caerostris extrusa]
MGTRHSLLTSGQCGPHRTPDDSEMADEENFSWVFESLVGFLKGPVWEAAVLTFIERKSCSIQWTAMRKNTKNI